MSEESTSRSNHEEHAAKNHDSENSTSNEAMKISISPARAATLTENIAQIHSRISSTANAHKITKPIRLVAVSKLKPASDILALHTASPSSPSSSSSLSLPQLHFGENYVQELLEKSRILPSTVRWHFIGGLQSNKAAQLAREVPGLWAVESCDSAKKAKLLDKGRGEVKSHKVEDGDASTSESKPQQEPLRVFVQVNTSGEDSKSGVEPKSDELLELCELVQSDECAHLKLRGLMTIGAIARSKATTAETENEDFVTLRENRDWVARKLDIPEDELELSMGMSNDFEGAIVQGSDEVRVGSTIFGERPPRSEAKVLETTEEGQK